MKLTIAQIDINDNQIEGNTDKIIEIIKTHDSSDIVLFSELAITGFPENENIEEKYQVGQIAFERLCRETKDLPTTIIIGHIEKAERSFYNSAFLITGGEASVIHRKAHLWIDDQSIFKVGHQSLLFPMDSYQVGAQICFDLEFPEGSRALTTAGADLILMPNGNMHPYANTHFVLSQARAIENQVFIASCNRVGKGHGGHFTGESLVVSPFGDILLKMGPEEERIETINIDLNNVVLSRTKYKYINHL